MPVDDLESVGSTRPPSSIAAAGSFVDADAPIQLNDDNITEWVINHHAPNLIEELDEPNLSNLSASWTSLCQGLLALRNGSSKTSQQNGGPDQSRVGQNKRRLRISFAELQRMRIRQLQCELTKDVIQMRCDGTNAPEWETRLKEYSESRTSHLHSIYLDHHGNPETPRSSPGTQRPRLHDRVQPATEGSLPSHRRVHGRRLRPD